jgi:hypothetical protein
MRRLYAAACLMLGGLVEIGGLVQQSTGSSSSSRLRLVGRWPQLQEGSSITSSYCRAWSLPPKRC